MMLKNPQFEFARVPYPVDSCAAAAADFCVPAAVGVVVVVVTASFAKSSSLASAYGMSVTATMLITTLLTAIVAARWCLRNERAVLIPPLLLVMGGVAALDTLRVAACSRKFLDGAWFPLAVAVVLFFVMSTWSRGSAALNAAIAAEQPPLAPFLEWVAQEPIQRAPRVAVYAVADTDVVPPALILNLRHYKVCPGPALPPCCWARKIPRAEALKMPTARSRVHIAALHVVFAIKMLQSRGCRSAGP